MKTLLFIFDIIILFFIFSSVGYKTDQLATTLLWIFICAHVLALNFAIYATYRIVMRKFFA